MPEGHADDLGREAADLYALPAEDFVAARNERAATLRSAGDRALADSVRALRKPSAAAAAVNRLVRERPEAVGELIEIGESLRRALDGLSRADLRDLNRQRQGATAALARVAGELAAAAGHPVGDAVLRQVTSTLLAAMADPAAAAEVRGGRLTTHLAHSGFGAGPAPQPAEAADLETVRREAAAARRAVRAAARELADAVAHREEATRERQELALRVVALERELQAAQELLDAAEMAEESAERRRQAAARALTRAEVDSDRARRRLEDAGTGAR